MNRILIYLHAGDLHGMGHFRRSKLVGEFLRYHGYEVTFTGELNDYCVNQLAPHFKLSETCMIDGDDVIVDSLYICQDFEEKLTSANNVIAISPMLHYNKYITHICARSPIMDTKNISNKEIYLDPYFAFWGCLIEERKFSYGNKKLDVGICISGSNQYFDVSNLVENLINSDRVGKISLFADPTYIKYAASSKVSVETNFRHDIWDFFKNIDMFITGDGLMIYEAVARNLPTISVSRCDHSHKNKFFSNRLFVEIPESDWNTQHCLENMFDTELWNRIQKNIYAAELKINRDKLGVAILKILRKGTRNEYYYR